MAPETPPSLSGDAHSDEVREPSINSSLLSAARVRDPDAWRELLAKFGPLVYAWGRKKGLQPVDAEDLCQDVFLAVSRNLAEFRRDSAGQSFRLWLWIITQRKICDRHRRRHSHDLVGGSVLKQLLEATQIPTEGDSGSDLAHWYESTDGFAGFESLSIAVARVQSSVQPATWEAFWLLTVEDMSPEDVAERLGMSRNNVYVARSRVVHRLRDFLTALDNA